jgi:hypothetical protein
VIFRRSCTRADRPTPGRGPSGRQAGKPSPCARSRTVRPQAADRPRLTREHRRRFFLSIWRSEKASTNTLRSLRLLLFFSQFTSTILIYVLQIQISLNICIFPIKCRPAPYASKCLVPGCLHTMLQVIYVLAREYVMCASRARHRREVESTF